MSRLYRELEKYGKTDYYPFHMPGHKRNPASVDGEFPFERDITEIEGFDNLHHPEGILKEAQEAVSRLYGTFESFYSVNGSTAALLAAVSAAVERGGKLLVARNCHKAVYNGIYLRELQPVYIYPERERELWINGGISPKKVEKLLAEQPGVEAVLITSPTYDGVVSDVEKIADIAHRHGIPLIVDEAHGAHFKFSEYFPAPAEELGADLVIQSLHKTLPSMTQTAVIHRCSDRVDGERLRRFLGIYQSSSPSYILMASMDACVDKLEREGESVFREYTERLERTRRRLKKCRCIRLFDPEGDRGAEIFSYDKSKLLLSVKGTGLTGKELYRILLEEYHLQMEMEAGDYVLAMTAAGDREEGFVRLCEAVEEIDRRLASEKDNWNIRKKAEELVGTEMQENLVKTEERDGEEPDAEPEEEPRQILSIAGAMDAPFEVCPLEDAPGRVSAEFAYLYPPGIPILVPGEEITGQFVRNVRRYMEQGLDLQGLCDYTNQTIRVCRR